ncbi:MAG: sulfotransferase family 2 domain-containing protein [Pseudomonadota bacterium]
MENHSFVKFVPGIYVIYLSVPKVASSSISHALLSACPTARADTNEHSMEGKSLTHWRPAYSPRPKLPVFSFTRHPIEKFVSYYKNKFLRAPEGKFELHRLTELGFSPQMSIEEVVAHMMDIPVSRMEHHAQPQHRILAPKGKLLANFVQPVEKIAEFWPAVQTVSLADFKIGISRNTTERNSVDLSEATLAALVSYYQTDFDLFGYQTPSGITAAAKSPSSSVRKDRRWLDSTLDHLNRENEEFMALARKLEDESFFSDYKQKAQASYNDFLAFANYRTSRRSLKSFVPLFGAKS